MAAGHRFGGDWTDLKLDALRKYLSFFTTALRHKGFELYYIDAFAGSGGRLIDKVIDSEPFLLGAEAKREQVYVPGSARIALQTSPPFQQIILIERHGRRSAALEALCAEYPELRARTQRGEANAALIEICRTTPWLRPHRGGSGIRAVLFLDPYGMNVEFTTLQEIAATQAVDVWYLFPLSGVYRQAARSGEKLTPEKRASITRILGTPDWEGAFYGREERRHDLFASLGDEENQAKLRRVADVRMIENYVKRRLESIFPHVSEPRSLTMKNGTPLFSLFFAVSSPNPKAIALARKVADHILTVGISSQVRPRK